MGTTFIMDHWDVHVSPPILYTTCTDIQIMDPTQAIGGRDRSRESSKAKRDDRNLKRGKYLLLVLVACPDHRRNSSTQSDVCGEWWDGVWSSLRSF